MVKKGIKLEVDKIAQGNAAQLLVASELNRRGCPAAVTLGNSPHVDVVCADPETGEFVFIQVKSFHIKDSACAVGKNAETDYGKKIFWVIVGLRDVEENLKDDFYIVPAKDMADGVSALHQSWLNALGVKGQKHKDSSIRKVHIGESKFEYDISAWKGKWELISNALKPRR